MQDAHALQVLVALGISVVVLTLLARRMRVAPPTVLLIGGDELAELHLADRTATEAALAALPAVAARLRIADEVTDRVRADYEERLADLTDPSDDPVGESDVPNRTGGRSAREQYRELRHALLADKRAALIRLRDAHLIDDIVLRRVQSRLDAEEMRLATTHEPE